MTDKFKTILSSMGLPENKMNSVVHSLNSKLNCDSKCQRRKKIDELRNKWESSKKNMETAPTQVEDAERNYYLYSEGEKKYKDKLLEKYSKNIELTQKKLMREHDKEMEELTEVIGDNQSQTIVINKLRELLDIKENKSEILRTRLDTDISKIETSQRRVIYEEKEVTWVGTVGWILLILYLMVLVIYIILRWNKLRLYGWLSVVLLIIYPFIVKYISRYIETNII